MKSKISSTKKGVYLLVIFTVGVLGIGSSGEINNEIKRDNTMIANTPMNQRKVKYLTATISVQEEVEQYKTLLQEVQILENANDLFDKGQVLKIVSSFEQLIQEEPRNYLYYYYLGRAQVILMNIYDSSSDRSKMEESIEKAIKAFKKSIGLNRRFAESYSYLGVIYGRKISQKGPAAGILYGRKIKKAHGKALKLDPLNPIVQVNKGINYLYTPQMWGGSMEKAKECFEKAIQLDSNFVDAYIWLGTIYEAKDKERAIAIYRKAVEVNPNSGWAKSKLEKLDK